MQKIMEKQLQSFLFQCIIVQSEFQEVYHEQSLLYLRKSTGER